MVRLQRGKVRVAVLLGNAKGGACCHGHSSSGLQGTAPFDSSGGGGAWLCHVWEREGERRAVPLLQTITFVRA